MVMWLVSKWVGASLGNPGMLDNGNGLYEDVTSWFESVICNVAHRSYSLMIFVCTRFYIFYFEFVKPLSNLISQP